MWISFLKNQRLILTILVCSFNVSAKNVFPKIDNFWLQAAPPNAKTMAAYAEISNDMNQEIILLDVYSPAFEMTMIHKTVIKDGIAKMIHQNKIAIKPHKKLIFKPGSFHIMLMQPLFKINQGDLIKINLIYRYNGKKRIQEMWFPVEFK